jgi:hypothetical protein
MEHVFIYFYISSCTLHITHTYMHIYTYVHTHRQIHRHTHNMLAVCSPHPCHDYNRFFTFDHCRSQRCDGNAEPKSIAHKPNSHDGTCCCAMSNSFCCLRAKYCERKMHQGQRLCWHKRNGFAGRNVTVVLVGVDVLLIT